MVMEHVHAAWTAYKKNFKPLFAALLLIVLVAGVLVVVDFFWLTPLLKEVAVQYTLSGQIVLPELGLTDLAYALVAAASIVLGFILQGGYITVCRDALKGKASAWSMFGAVKKNWKTYLGIGLLVFAVELILLLFIFAALLVGKSMGSQMLLVAGLMMLCYIVFIFAALSLVFSYPAAVVDNLGAVEAVKSSYRTVRHNLLGVIALIIMLYIVAAALVVVSLIVLLLLVSLLVFLVSFVYPLFDVSLMVRFYVAFYASLVASLSVLYLGMVSFYTVNRNPAKPEKNAVKRKKTAKTRKRR